MLQQAILKSPSQQLYEEDFWLWTQAMVEALKSGSFSQLDLQNLAEEVESLGRSDRRELQSRLTVLLMHLLKWQFQSLKGRFPAACGVRYPNERVYSQKS